MKIAPANLEVLKIKVLVERLIAVLGNNES